MNHEDMDWESKGNEGALHASRGRGLVEVLRSLPKKEFNALVTRVDVRADLPRIVAPTLVVSTTADRLVSPELHRDVASAIPHAEVVEIPTGHLPFVESPVAWATAITGFLATSA